MNAVAPDLPALPPLVERALKAVKSTRSLTVLSMDDMRALCQLAVVQHDFISGLSMVCAVSVERRLAIEPTSLQAAITAAMAEIIPPTAAPTESKAS